MWVSMASLPAAPLPPPRPPVAGIDTAVDSGVAGATVASGIGGAAFVYGTAIAPGAARRAPSRTVTGAALLTDPGASALTRRTATGTAVSKPGRVALTCRRFTLARRGAIRAAAAADGQEYAEARRRDSPSPRVHDGSRYA